MEKAIVINPKPDTFSLSTNYSNCFQKFPQIKTLSQYLTPETRYLLFLLIITFAHFPLPTEDLGLTQI